MNRVAKRGKENPFVRFITFNNNVLSKMCWEPQPRHLNVKGPVISIILNMAKKCPSARTILIWPPRGRVAIVNNNYLCIAHTEVPVYGKPGNPLLRRIFSPFHAFNHSNHTNASALALGCIM